MNVPPDRRGLIHETDAESLRAFGKLVCASTFSHNLAFRAKCGASNIRGNDPAFSAQDLLDGNKNTYWSTDDSMTTPQVTFRLAGLRSGSTSSGFVNIFAWVSGLRVRSQTPGQPRVVGIGWGNQCGFLSDRSIAQHSRDHTRSPSSHRVAGLSRVVREFGLFAENSA